VPSLIFVGTCVSERLVLVGNAGGTNVGWSLWKAAQEKGLEGEFCDARTAFAGPRLLARLSWWLRRRRPLRLDRFSREVVAGCRRLRAAWLLSTGLAPLTAAALEELGRMGIRRLNFLTDDPWNPAHRAPWFFRALPAYDVVFSPRRANLPDLCSAGCRYVEYLPFGFDPCLSFPEPAGPRQETPEPAADVMFAGGADRDRVPYIARLHHDGFRVAVFGDYWERFPETRRCSRGHAPPDLLRRATAEAKVALCLVRRANRDGHVMRSFEIPAMRACMLTEDTDEHRQIFGPDGQRVVYFRSLDEMTGKLRWLLDRPDERARLAAAAHRLIAVEGKNTYRDRLETMFSLIGEHR
jgi:hypothetical protein